MAKASDKKSAPATASQKYAAPTKSSTNKKTAKKEIKKTTTSATKKSVTATTTTKSVPKVAAVAAFVTPAAAIAATKKSASVASTAKTVAKKKTGTVSNEEIIRIFVELAAFEQKAKEKQYVVKAYKEVAIALTRFSNEGKKITCGADVAHIGGVGAISVKKIDEFLESGKVERLETLKQQIGDLDEAFFDAFDPKNASSSNLKPADNSGPFNPKPPTAAQRAQIKAAADVLSSKSNDDLKELARKNDQKISGNKSELVERLAHQVVLGRVNRCQACGGGKPIFDEKTGAYSCPGFRDDEDFQFCGRKFDNADGSMRSAWTP